jgi:hypothetical protein
MAMERRLVRGEEIPEGQAAARGYGVTHLLVTPALADQYGVTLGGLEARPDLRLVHLSGDRRGPYVAVFALSGAR